MEARNRPLAPHIQIYRPQLTSVLSITHRATGIALAAGMLVVVWWLVALAGGPASYADAAAIIGSWPGLVVLVGFTFALFYHLANGIRHLFWDAGYGFELSTAYASGTAVVIASVVLTAATWAAAFALR